MSGLADLIERLEKLEGPDAFLDEAIWEAIGNWPAPEYRSCNYMKAFGTPLTGSLDAAIALVERGLPGWKKQIWDAGIFGADRPTTAIFEPGFARLSRAGEPFRKAEASAHTLPIALCLALLRALQQEEKR